jgi:hypothetical protein
MVGRSKRPSKQPQPRVFMQAGVAPSKIIYPVLCSLHVKDMFKSSHHVKLVFYADDAAIIATFPQPALFVNYLESYPIGLERWLRELRFSINMSKSNQMLFAQTARRIPTLRPVQLFGKLVQSVDSVRYLDVTFHTRLIWSNHIGQVRKKWQRDWECRDFP